MKLFSRPEPKTNPPDTRGNVSWYVNADDYVEFVSTACDTSEVYPEVCSTMSYERLVGRDYARMAKLAETESYSRGISGRCGYCGRRVTSTQPTCDGCGAPL